MICPLKFITKFRLRGDQMKFDVDLLIYGAIFLGVLLAVEGLYRLVFGRTIALHKRLNRRLAMLESAKERTEVIKKLRKETSQHRRWSRIPFYSLLAERAVQAKIAFPPWALIALMGACAAVSFVALSLATAAGMTIKLALALGFGIGGVWFWIAQKARKRFALIEEQLPEAIDLIVRSLKVGYPFVQALAAAAKESPDPLGSELGLIADEATYGRDLGEALADFAERMQMQDLRFLAVAVSIQQSSGGNLAEILQGLSNVIRARFRLARRVRAITAEAKWSGHFLSGFPIAAMFLITLIKPDYYDEVKESALFVPVALIVCALLIVNLLYMKKMVQIRV